MKIKFYIILICLAFMFLFNMQAKASLQSLWKLVGGNITPVNNSWDLKIPTLISCDTIDTDASGNLSCGTDASGGAGSQTPWTSNIDGAGYNLSNVRILTVANIISTSTSADNYFLGKVGIGTTTPAYKLDVYGNIRADGDVRTTGTFYGDTWSSITGNSMAIQPSGDVDDFFSFKTPAHRPTIKREGGKFIYLESSNVYDVGISARADDTYSGTLNYEKDNHMLTMLGKNSPLGFKANSDYDDYIKIQTTSNTPEITVASSSALKINAGGTNSLLLNHAGGNVGIGTSSPLSTFSMNSGTNGFRIDSSGIVQQGTWNGTALTDAYVSNTLTVDGYMQDTDIDTLAKLNAWLPGETIASTTWAGASSILTVGVLDSGSITSNFGNIDIGSSNFDADGVITSTGSIDFGGATSLEIPNSTNPTVDATGETAINSTTASSSLRYYDGVAERALFDIDEKCFTIASTTFDNFDNIPLWSPERDFTVTSMTCRASGGTSLVVTLGDGTNDMDAMTCSTTKTNDDGSIANTNFTIGEQMEVDFGTNTGEVNFINYCISFRYSAD